MWDQEILCVLPNDLQTTLGIFMLEPRNRSKSHAKTSYFITCELKLLCNTTNSLNELEYIHKVTKGTTPLGASLGFPRKVAY